MDDNENISAAQDLKAIYSVEWRDGDYQWRDEASVQLWQL